MSDGVERGMKCEAAARAGAGFESMIGSCFVYRMVQLKCFNG